MDQTEQDRERLNRRDFLAKSGALGVGIVGLASLASCESSALVTDAGAAAPRATDTEAETATAPPSTTDSGKSRVAHLRHSGLVTSGSNVDRAIALAMLDRGVMHVFGTDTPEEAWEQVASPGDVVALKVNCICSLLSTNPNVAYAVAQRLMDVGVRPSDLVIFDRTSGELTNAGYTLNRANPEQPRCHGTDGEVAGPFSYGEYEGNLSQLLTRADVLVNLPVLKDHGGAQVTLSMKNHYGTIDNPGPYHGNNCDPFIGHINMLPEIKDKTKLIVLDASRGCWRNGPGPGPNAIWRHNGLVVATDPVACDTLGNEIINAQRAEKGHGPVSQEADGLAKHILTAQKLGLGTAQRSEMDVLEETLA
jgi:uncharacterized protein (DUF362 family)